MDLQTRKLNIIEYLIGINDEKIFGLIEDLIRKSKSDQDVAYRKFTQEEMIDRARESNKDYISGNITDQEELKKESKNW